jgi:hypothetical protein
MKSIARKALRFAAVACALGASLASAAPPAMTDPLIGLSFDPAQIRFAAWADTQTTRKALGNEKKWIFACARSPEKTLCVVAGHRRVQPDGEGAAVLEPDFGAVIVKQGRRQAVLGVPERMFDEPAIVSGAERDRLLRDAVARYTKAFGSTAKLQAAISTQGVSIDSLPPPLVEALKAGGISVPSATPPN